MVVDFSATPSDAGLQQAADLRRRQRERDKELEDRVLDALALEEEAKGHLIEADRVAQRGVVVAERDRRERESELAEAEEDTKVAIGNRRLGRLPVEPPPVAKAPIEPSAKVELDALAASRTTSKPKDRQR